MTPYNLLFIFGIKQIMEKDILNYSPTVMFRGTPCKLIAPSRRNDAHYRGNLRIKQNKKGIELRVCLQP